MCPAQWLRPLLASLAPHRVYSSFKMPHESIRHYQTNRMLGADPHLPEHCIPSCYGKDHLAANFHTLQSRYMINTAMLPVQYSPPITQTLHLAPATSHLLHSRHHRLATPSFWLGTLERVQRTYVPRGSPPWIGSARKTGICATIKNTRQSQQMQRER
jgi:hypothetical protein